MRRSARAGVAVDRRRPPEHEQVSGAHRRGDAGQGGFGRLHRCFIGRRVAGVTGPPRLVIPCQDQRIGGSCAAGPAQRGERGDAQARAARTEIRRPPRAPCQAAAGAG